MASQKPNMGEAQILSMNIAAQTAAWDYEDSLNDFEQAIAMLDKISDGLPDDPITTRALNGLHDTLSNIHADFEANIVRH